MLLKHKNPNIETKIYCGIHDRDIYVISSSGYLMGIIPKKQLPKDFLDNFVENDVQLEQPVISEEVLKLDDEKEDYEY